MKMIIVQILMCVFGMYLTQTSSDTPSPVLTGIWCLLLSYWMAMFINELKDRKEIS